MHSITAVREAAFDAGEAGAVHALSAWVSSTSTPNHRRSKSLNELAQLGPNARALRDEVTLLVVPRVNPDGFERYQDPDFEDGIDPRHNDSNLDLNRLYGPDADADPTTAPEVVAVESVVEAHQPDLIVDYHHQVTYQTEDGAMVTMSALWSTNPRVATEVADDGRRAAAVVGDSLAGSRTPDRRATASWLVRH